METGVLRSNKVNNGLLPDRGACIQVIGSDVEAFYPSLEAAEVAEIVYNAVMKTNKYERNPSRNHNLEYTILL